ncbi:cytochrome P450 52A11 [Penicillium manginii]|uniref:cytochrome P450 52A11 n=1 Tax=Penicillium manginii TaxID=203109 RepID=UPI002548E3AB|nr:cytochrome P450 52A11 [Penicillium manginii]KAJ5742111.1 cytochrome P450 52A11 [Penicillium manginii]
MIIVDNLWSVAVASGLLAIFINLLWVRFKEYKGRKAHGCGVIPSYPQWDRILGLDLALSQMKALRGDTFISWLAAIHEGQPSTFKIRFLGKRQIYTTDTENRKAMTAINWKDFGISPLRRSTKAFHPFADKGVNTVDGDDWVFSHFLIKPFFNRDFYMNTDRIRPYVESLFTLLLPDGETFNIQPLLQRWFLDLTTDFILGEPVGVLHQPDKARITWAMLDVLRGSRQRMQVAVYEVHAFVDTHITETYKEIRIRKGHIVAGEKLSLLLVPNNDTTSIFISNTLWHLVRHPDAWARCREEVLTAVQGDDDEAVGKLTFSALRGIKFLNAFRICLNDTTLLRGGGKDGQDPILVCKGDMVQVTKISQQRNRIYWGEDTDDFRPERFLALKPFWEFVPFSGGPRRCPAQMMVMTESAYMLARLVMRYERIESRDANPYHAIMRIRPSNKTGVLVAFHKAQEGN